MEVAISRMQTRFDSTAIIGNQIDTDMVLAQKTGICGVLVLSGETSLDRL